MFLNDSIVTFVTTVHKFFLSFLKGTYRKKRAKSKKVDIGTNFNKKSFNKKCKILFIRFNISNLCWIAKLNSEEF